MTEIFAPPAPRTWAAELWRAGLHTIPLVGQYKTPFGTDHRALADSPPDLAATEATDYSGGLAFISGTEHPGGGFVTLIDVDKSMFDRIPVPSRGIIYTSDGTADGKKHIAFLTDKRLAGQIRLTIDGDANAAIEIKGYGFSLRDYPSLPANKPRGYTPTYLAGEHPGTVELDTVVDGFRLALEKQYGKEITVDDPRKRRKSNSAYDASTRPQDPPEAVARLDAALESLGAGLGPPARDGWQLGSCPLHSPGRTEGNASFSISYPIGRWLCRSCSPDGGWLDQLAGKLNVSWPAFKPAPRPRPVAPNRPLDDGDPGGDLFPDGDPIDIDRFGHVNGKPAGRDDLTGSGRAVIRTKAIASDANDVSPDTKRLKNRELFTKGAPSEQLPIFTVEDLTRATKWEDLLELLKSADLDPDSAATRALSTCGGTKYPACPEHGVRHHKTKHAYCGLTYHAGCFSRESWAVARLTLPDLEDGAVYHTTVMEREFFPDPNDRFPDTGDQVREALDVWSAASSKFSSWKGLKGELMYRSVVFYLFKNRVLARYKIQYREESVGALDKQINKIADVVGATRVSEAATPSGEIALSQGIYDASTHLAYIEDDEFMAFRGYLRATKRARLFQTYGAYREDLEQEKIDAKAEEIETPDCDVCGVSTKWYAYPPGVTPELGAQPPIRPRKQWFRRRAA